MAWAAALGVAVHALPALAQDRGLTATLEAASDERRPRRARVRATRSDSRSPFLRVAETAEKVIRVRRHLGSQVDFRWCNFRVWGYSGVA